MSLIIAETYDSYAIAFHGVRGERRNALYEAGSRPFDLTQSNPGVDLLYHLAQVVEDKIFFLPLHD